MKTTRHLFSPRESRLARLFMVGFALCLAPVGAQSISQPTSSGATAPGTAASTVTSPPTANTSPYNSPAAGTSTVPAGTYIPNAANAQAGTAKTGTVTSSVNAGGGSGSGQGAGTTSTSNP